MTSPLDQGAAVRLPARYFTHVAGFGDSTAYIESGDEHGAILVFRSGRRKDTTGYDRAYCLKCVADGDFKEITESEARALLDKPAPQINPEDRRNGPWKCNVCCDYGEHIVRFHSKGQDKERCPHGCPLNPRPSWLKVPKPAAPRDGQKDTADASLIRSHLIKQARWFREDGNWNAEGARTADDVLAAFDRVIAAMQRPQGGGDETMTRAEVEALMATTLPCGHPEACAIMHDPQGARISCGWCDAVRKAGAKERERAGGGEVSQAISDVLWDMQPDAIMPISIREAHRRILALVAPRQGEGWIACSESLPESGARVLIATDAAVGEAFYDRATGDWHWSRGWGNPTPNFWRPMPALPAPPTDAPKPEGRT